MNQINEFTLDTELRHLSLKHRINLAAILDVGDSWKVLASLIPKPDSQDGFLLTSANILTLEQQKYVHNGSPTQALLDYWGTSGRKRANLGLFIDLLAKCKLYRAADFICKDVLNIDAISTKNYNYYDDDTKLLSNATVIEQFDSDFNYNRNSFSNENKSKLLTFDNNFTDKQLNQRPPTPTAPIQSFSSLNLNSSQFENNDIQITTEIPRYLFSDLKLATNNFNDIPLSQGGSQLGHGAFGSVYYGKLQNNKLIAVKILKNDFKKQFIAELEIMSQFKHENLLSIVGISYDGPSLCLVYEYMVNESLLDRIACKNNTSPLSWQTRIKIAIGTARGICYLHTFKENPYVHRDIKSANILLDENWVPKVGDFGLARIGSTGLNTSTKSLATTIIGTSVYMAPEAYRGDVSVKLDTFSFGVVLLELLTGLLPYDEGRDEPDILSYLEEQINDHEENEEQDNILINNFIDPAAGQWNEKIAFELYKISRVCTEQRKKNRPSMVEVRNFT